MSAVLVVTALTLLPFSFTGWSVNGFGAVAALLAITGITTRIREARNNT